MALKFVDDVDVNGFDDELSATEIANLVKNFRNFLRNNNRRARGKKNAKPRNFRRKIGRASCRERVFNWV